MNLVLVTWRDAWFQQDDTNDPDDFLVQTAGWELTRTEHFLKVGSEQLPDDTFRAITWIPLESVLAIRGISPAESPVVKFHGTRTSA